MKVQFLGGKGTLLMRMKEANSPRTHVWLMSSMPAIRGRPGCGVPEAGKPFGMDAERRGIKLRNSRWIQAVAAEAEKMTEEQSWSVCIKASCFKLQELAIEGA
jgi:hypothetical protein